jgi:hypothetical protein
MTGKKFSFRVFTSFILAWTFLILIVSGAVLYVAPPGRIANWTRWQLMILTKEQWQAVHTLTALTFLVGGIFHLLKFNWRAFLAYLKRKGAAGFQYRHEMLFSIVLFSAVLAGTVAQRAPFASVMAIGDSIRNSREPAANEPPIPHMEEMTLSALAQNMQMETDRLIATLRFKGLVDAAPDAVLRDLAKKHDCSPLDIYNSLREFQQEQSATSHGAPGEGGGGGPGQKTLAQVCGELGLSTDSAVAVLAGRGVKADPGEKLHEIAVRSTIKPYELSELLKAASAGTAKPDSD